MSKEGQKNPPSTAVSSRFVDMAKTGAGGRRHLKSLITNGLKRAKLRRLPGMPPAFLEKREVMVSRAAIESVLFVRSYPSMKCQGGTDYHG